MLLQCLCGFLLGLYPESCMSRQTGDSKMPLGMSVRVDVCPTINWQFVQGVLSFLAICVHDSPNMVEVQSGKMMDG